MEKNKLNDLKEEMNEEERKELYNYFLRRGENPEEIIMRAVEFIKRMEEKMRKVRGER